MSDPVLLWNEVSLEANRISHTNGRGEQAGPPLSARALAIVHLAMYDAVAGVINNSAVLPYYLTPPPAAPIADLTEPSEMGAAVSAAVAAAAHRTLSELFPSLRPFFDSIFAGAGDRGSAGDIFGDIAAANILADRQNDPGAGSATYKPSSGRGRHRPDPDNPGQGFHAPDFGKLTKGFAVTHRHELAPPPLDTPEYSAALEQVFRKGIKPELTGTLPAGPAPRAPDETLAGIFWGYDGARELGTPPRLYNQIIRRVALRRSPGNPAVPNTVVQNAALFALVNTALADAGILCWDQKYIHEFWRPIVGIREHDMSMGPAANVPDDKIAALCDPFWLPLGAPNTNGREKNFTPPFPAYPSGHATFGAAALHAARLFYGEGGVYSDDTLADDSLFDGLSFVSEELNGINTDNTGAIRPRHLRTFPGGLRQMIEENGRSRVYLGVHWIFDAFAVDEDGEPDLRRTQEIDGVGLPFGGVPLGLKIAEDIFNHSKNPNWISPVGPRAVMLAPAGERTETNASSFQPTSLSR